MLVAVESLDRRLSLGVRVHLDETEPPAAPRVTIFDEMGAPHRAEPGEHRLQVGLVDVVGEVADIQSLPHDGTPETKGLRSSGRFHVGVERDSPPEPCY